MLLIIKKSKKTINYKYCLLRADNIPAIPKNQVQYWFP